MNLTEQSCVFFFFLSCVFFFHMYHSHGPGAGGPLNLELLIELPPKVIEYYLYEGSLLFL